MTTRLKLSLLGGLTLQLNGQPVTGLASRKAEALLAYLAYTGREHARETLADLLWDDRSQAQALGNLRVLLTSLRQAVGEHLLITRSTVAFHTESDYWLDATELERQLRLVREALIQTSQLSRQQATQLEQALTLYQGDFLHGLFVREGRGFEEWASVERERLRQWVVEGLHALVAFYLNTGEYDQGKERAARLLQLDPLREEAHRQMMSLLARSGQTAAALTQYEMCRKILLAELGVDPDPETEALYERLKDAASAYRHNLPAQTTPFLGRVSDLAHITEVLAKPECRLLTLIGPGGVGKTRLALQLASEKIGAFLNGVYFVSLAPVRSETLIAALAEALQFVFDGKESTRTQLLNYLKHKELLLVLDNFEHLVSATALLTEIHQQASGVKMLVTSRERLNLRGEWLYEVGGLSVPDRVLDNWVGAEQYDAVQLFLHGARRVQHTFALTADNTNALIRICRSVGGLPLGIELAAAWLRSLTMAEIAQEIERGLDFLAVPLRDLPERHRSLRVVFDYAWQTLTQAEQAVFRRLCLLRGAFTREAAQMVGQAALPSLAALVDKSFLTHTPTGRYVIHEYLRQYGEEKLAHSPAEREQAETSRATHYASYVREIEPRLHGPEQMVTFQDLGEAIDNVRATWEWAIAHQRFDLLAEVLEGLTSYHLQRGLYFESELMLENACVVLRPLAPANREAQFLLARLLSQLGRSCYLTRPQEKAQQVYEESLAFFRAMGAHKETASPLHGLGYLAMLRGQYAEAEACLNESLTIARSANDLQQMAENLDTLAQCADEQGDYARAMKYGEESLALQRQSGDPRGLYAGLNSYGNSLIHAGEYAAADALLEEAVEIATHLNYKLGMATAYNSRGNSAYYLGQYAASGDYLRASLEICRETNDYWGEAMALNSLGELAEIQGNLSDAKDLYRQSLGLYRQHDIKSGLASTLSSLVVVCVACDEEAEARVYLREAIQESAAAGTTPMTLKALLGWGQLLQRADHIEAAQRVMSLIIQHPATDKPYREKAEHQLRLEWGLALLTMPDPEAVLAEIVTTIA